MKYGTDKQVKQNRKMYGRRIQQLDHILKDNTFLVDGGYREFISSMYKALVSGRRITPKMESAITKVVKNYAKHINPEHQIKRVEYIEKTLDKINKIRSLLFECKFSPDYSYGKEMFLDSIETQVRQRASLSQKQRMTLNKFYTQFTKRLKKGTLSKKQPWHEEKKVKKSLDFLAFSS
jgi:hypothetical protein|tara:strand:+ start:1462 stop:1995 length:534 start_codon:yes stop_codon:yes gene_type:complete